MSGHRVNAFMTCSTASLYILIHVAYYEEFHFSFNMCIIWSLPILSGTYILINIYVPDFIYTHMMNIPAVYTVKKWAKFLSIKLSQYFLTQLWAGYITKCIIHKFYQYLRKKYISGELSHKSIYLLWIYIYGNHSNWTCGRKFFISGSINAPLL